MMQYIRTYSAASFDHDTIHDNISIFKLVPKLTADNNCEKRIVKCARGKIEPGTFHTESKHLTTELLRHFFVYIISFILGDQFGIVAIFH